MPVIANTWRKYRIIATYCCSGTKITFQQVKNENKCKEKHVLRPKKTLRHKNIFPARLDTCLFCFVDWLSATSHRCGIPESDYFTYFRHFMRQSRRFRKYSALTPFRQSMLLSQLINDDAMTCAISAWVSLATWIIREEMEDDIHVCSIVRTDISTRKQVKYRFSHNILL